MSQKIRIASFNVENLFGRTKAFNFKNKSRGDEVLARVDAFRKILEKAIYSDADKKFLLKEFTQGSNGKEPLKEYIKLLENRGKLWKRRTFKRIGVKAAGSGDWDGSIVFKKDKYSEIGRKNTGKVINRVKANIACIVEADDRTSLRKFDTEVLRSKYRYEILMDGNDSRGIDLGLYSKFPIGVIRTHMFDGSSRSKTFSRDCPEYEVLLPTGESLFILCNHLKSKGYDSNGRASARRKKQAQAIADILKKYDLKKQFVVVAGDLNDTPDSAPLKPLMDVANLFDVLELQFPNEPHKRWTYHYRKFEQIDYLLVSKPLKERFLKAGVERRGMYNLKKLTESKAFIEDEVQFKQVTHWTNAASDHGAVWADFDI